MPWSAAPTVDVLTLWSTPRARVTDPETSHQAATRAAMRAPTIKARVVAILNEYPEGLTDFEGADRSGLGDNFRKRRADLTNEGLVCWTGRTRLSPTGSDARVWRLV